MTNSRLLQTATLLDSGEVLMAGGRQLPGTLDVAEVYNPVNGIFTATAGAMNQARHHHTATLLKDKTVLVAGGDNGGGLLVATALFSAELYDPKTDRFTITGALFSPRTWHTATLLDDGKVLAAGGSPAVDSTFDPFTGTGTGLPIGALPSAELYDPSSKQFFGNPGAMNDARTEHSAALIKGCHCDAENHVLLAGGIDISGTTLTSAEVFDESSNAFTLTGSMNEARHNHTATTLKNGKVLITGGVDNSLNLLATAEIWDPKTGNFTPTAGPMTVARAFHTAELLANGRVLIAGGSGDDSAEIFNPSTGKFTPTPGLMNDVRFVHTATQIGGRVLIAGGGLILPTNTGELQSSSSLNTAEVFSPSTGTFTPTHTTMVRSRASHAATKLDDGKVLITGGEDLTRRDFDSSELYDSGAGTFRCVGGVRAGDCVTSLHQPRFAQTATALTGDTEVLLAGGSGSSGPMATAEIYHAGSRTFTCVGGVSPLPPMCNDSMSQPRIDHSAIALSSGKVLIAGGGVAVPDATDTAELYDPAKRVFVPTGSMTVARQEFAVALFSSGPLARQVLVTGGADASGNFFYDSAELYDPATGRFTATGSMLVPRFLHSATLLQTGPHAGEILIAGGSGDQTAEFYNPRTRSFGRAGKMTQIVFAPIVNTLENGEVLVAGGATFNSQGQIAPVSGAELYDPATNEFKAVPPMTTGRFFGAGAFLDPSLVSGKEAGDILIAGGLGTNSTLASSELFVPGTTTASSAIRSSDNPPMSPAAMRQAIAQSVAAMRQPSGVGAAARLRTRR